MYQKLLIISSNTWDDELKDLKAKSIDAHVLWKNCGCPLTGDVYNLKRTANAQSKLANRQKTLTKLLMFLMIYMNICYKKTSLPFGSLGRLNFVVKSNLLSLSLVAAQLLVQACSKTAAKLLAIRAISFSPSTNSEGLTLLQNLEDQDFQKAGWSFCNKYSCKSLETSTISSVFFGD